MKNTGFTRGCLKETSFKLPSSEENIDVPALLKPTRVNLLLCAALVAASTVGAVAIGEIHTGHGMLCGTAYAVGATCGLGLLLFRALPRGLVGALGSWPVWLAVLAVLAVADQAHYAASRQSADPLTSAQALELPAAALLHGREPYSVHLAHDAPISPGPGWILLLLPLTALHATGLLCMAALAAAAFALHGRKPVAAGLLCVFLLAGPLFESQAANGQDLYAISLACVVVIVALERYAETTYPLLILGIAAGCIGTARIPMVLMLCVPGLGLARRDRRGGVVFSATMLAAAALLDGLFALWAYRAGDVFQPLHVLGRGTASAGHGVQVTVLLLGGGAVLWTVRRMRGEAADWMLGMWLLMSALFITEAAKEFGQMRHDLRWEGSTYMTFSLPLLAAVVALRAGNSRILAISDETQGSTSEAWSAGE